MNLSEEPSDNLVIGNVTLSNAQPSVFTRVNGTTYTVLVTPDADGTVEVSVGVGENKSTK